VFGGGGGGGGVTRDGKRRDVFLNRTLVGGEKTRSVS